MNTAPSPEEIERQYNRQRQMQMESSAEQTAHSVAASGIDVGDLRRKEFIESITEPNIERRSDLLPEGESRDIEQKLSAEFGRHTVLSNISKDEWESQRYKDKSRAILTKMEYRPLTGPGHACDPIDYEIMTGQPDNRPVLTSDRARQLDAAFEERTMARALAIDGQAFKGVTEVTAVAKSETLDDGPTSPAGIMGRIKSALGG